MKNMKSPVLFMIFKRPETTKRVFERIREVQPPRLYIAADGPRKDRKDEVDKCISTRKIVENIDWPCEVFRLYREENLGCGKGVSSAISWFFEHEEQGIIIEDDILPHVDFFNYCDEMLERYKDDEEIQLIAGTNYFYGGYPANVSYYLSCFMSIWGWASWRRVWETYEFDVNKLDASRIRKQLYKMLPQKCARFYMNIFHEMAEFKVDTWDFQLFLNQQYYGRHSISPFVNMVENIGFGVEGATHTNSADLNVTAHKSNSPFPIIHPDTHFYCKKADFVAMKNNGQYEKSVIDKLRLLPYRINRKLKNVFQK